MTEKQFKKELEEIPLIVLARTILDKFECKYTLKGKTSLMMTSPYRQEDSASWSVDSTKKITKDFGGDGTSTFGNFGFIKTFFAKSYLSQQNPELAAISKNIPALCQKIIDWLPTYFSDTKVSFANKMNGEYSDFVDYIVSQKKLSEPVVQEVFKKFPNAASFGFDKKFLSQLDFTKQKEYEILPWTYLGDNISFLVINPTLSKTAKTPINNLISFEPNVNTTNINIRDYIFNIDNIEQDTTINVWNIKPNNGFEDKNIFFLLDSKTQKPSPKQLEQLSEKNVMLNFGFGYGFTQTTFDTFSENNILCLKINPSDKKSLIQIPSKKQTLELAAYNKSDTETITKLVNSYKPEIQTKEETFEITSFDNEADSIQKVLNLFVQLAAQDANNQTLNHFLNNRGYKKYINNDKNNTIANHFINQAKLGYVTKQTYQKLIETLSQSMKNPYQALINAGLVRRYTYKYNFKDNEMITSQLSEQEYQTLIKKGDKKLLDTLIFQEHISDSEPPVKTYFPFICNFTNRVLIPTFSRDNNVITLTGRDIRSKDELEDENYSKYVFLPSLPVASNRFTKGNTLYNVNHIQPNQPLYICEGQFDALSMQLHKNVNAIALGGSKLTQNQIEQLTQINPSEIVLSLDNDSTGITSTLNIGSALWAAGFKNIKVVGFKDSKAKDFDELLTANPSTELDIQSFGDFFTNHIDFPPVSEKSFITFKKTLETAKPLLVYGSEQEKKNFVFKLLKSLGKTIGELPVHKNFDNNEFQK